MAREKRFPFLSRVLIFACFSLPTAFCTWKYYNQYVYGSGDNIMTTFHQHGGPNSSYHQWIMECLDGEGMISMSDWINDYERLEAFACKFLFPNKPPALRYPYYESCHIRNYTVQNFCFDPFRADVTIHTFVTGFWDNDQQYTVWSLTTDITQLYKCCKVPGGYYIDYVSCYYMPTHDPYYEYYDSPQLILVQCAAGYVITGVSKKISPWTSLWNIDWFQCCRIGYGAPAAVSPPVVYGSSGTPTYIARENLQDAPVPRAYQHQYSSQGIARSDCEAVPLSSWPTRTDFRALGMNVTQSTGSSCSSRYIKSATPLSIRYRDGNTDHAADHSADDVDEHELF